MWTKTRVHDREDVKTLRKFKYLKGTEASGDGIARAIGTMLDQHTGMRNPFAAVEWSAEGCLIELHFISTGAVTAGGSDAFTARWSDGAEDYQCDRCLNASPGQRGRGPGV
jgi:hypothetical protein